MIKNHMNTYRRAMKGYACDNGTCTSVTVYEDKDSCNSACSVPKTCYDRMSLNGGIASLTYYDQSDSSMCSKGTPGCWTSGEGRVAPNKEKVDYSVAVPYAWFSHKGVNIGNHNSVKTQCSTNAGCEKDSGTPSALCIGGKCWLDVPGNCDNDDNALTFQCSGGGGSVCTSHDDCSKDITGTVQGVCIKQTESDATGKCAAQKGGICTKREDCIGYKEDADIHCGSAGTCYGGANEWSGRTCRCPSCWWEVVAGEKLTAQDNPEYTPGTPMCWALADATDTETLEKVITAKDCNSLYPKCIVVQADNVCGGNCAGCMTGSLKGEPVAGSEGYACPEWTYTDDKGVKHDGKNECNQGTCESVDNLYASAHRCEAGEARQNYKDITPVGGIPSANASTYGRTDPDWCGGHYVHFDVRNNKLPFGSDGTAKANFKSITCPPTLPT